MSDITKNLEAEEPQVTPQRRAFTLIELLCVVAVIAILACIAVPNFLEAQVRSKVARSLDEMEVMAAALEAYWIDHRAYPPNVIEMLVVRLPTTATLADPRIVWSQRIEVGDNLWLCETSNSVTRRAGRVAKPPASDCPLAYNFATLFRLTTPVPYLHVLPMDPFFSSASSGGRYYLFNSPSFWAAPGSTTPTLWLMSNMRPYGYFNFTGVRPDGLPVVGFGRTLPHILTSFGPDVRPSFTDAEIQFPPIYDPTNGTTSLGDLILPAAQ